MNTTDVAIITCGLKKKKVAAPAQDFYTGTSFRVYCTYVSENFKNWVILSAKYGMVLPSQVLEPYDTYIKDLSAEDKRILMNRFICSLKDTFPKAGKFIFFVSDAYKKAILEVISGYNISVEFPFEGLRFGQKLQFMRTGNSSILNLEELADFFRSKLDKDVTYELKYLVSLIRDEYAPGRYSPTYARRRVASLTVNEGDAEMKNYPLFYKVADKQYCLNDSERVKTTKKLF